MLNMVLETPRKNLDAFEMRSEYRNFSILQWAGWLNPPFVLFFMTGICWKLSAAVQDREIRSVAVWLKGKIQQK